MIVIAGTVRVPPENIDKARPHMEAMVTASRAETGCTSYSYAKTCSIPASFTSSRCGRATPR